MIHTHTQTQLFCFEKKRKKVQISPLMMNKQTQITYALDFSFYPANIITLEYWQGILFEFRPHWHKQTSSYQVGYMHDKYQVFSYNVKSTDQPLPSRCTHTHTHTPTPTHTLLISELEDTTFLIRSAVEMY